MALFELKGKSIQQLHRADFGALGILERQDLQAVFRDYIHAVAPDSLVISEEFSGWDRSARRIDLLCVDQNARLVVVELKRTSDNDLIDLQALRYAAMVSQMTFDEAVDAYRTYLSRRGISIDARISLLEFLGWSDPSDGRFGDDVRIVLAATDFNAEVTSTILWLNEREVDITCIRLQPYYLNDTIVLDIQQIIPLPEAADYQVQIRQKQREARAVAEHGTDRTRYDFITATTRHASLSKRAAALAIVRYLTANGVTPEQVEETAGRRIFIDVEGTIEGEAFRAELTSRRPNDLIFPKRYFTTDDQLFFLNGRTYALTNQWTGAAMEIFAATLAARFPTIEFQLRPASASGETES
jgi:hypothetical protein